MRETANWRHALSQPGEELLLVGSAADEVMSRDDFSLEMLPSGSQVCGDNRHEHIFEKMRDQVGGNFKYNKKYLVLAIEQVGKSQENDGSRCDYAFGSLSDSIRGGGIRKLFGSHVKTRFIPSLP